MLGGRGCQQEVTMSQIPGRDGAAVRKGERVPEGLWLRCPDCERMLFRKKVEENLHVCPECQYHFRISAQERIRQLCDEGSFEERYTEVMPTDPLAFTDRKPYAQRLRDEHAQY